MGINLFHVYVYMADLFGDVVNNHAAPIFL